MLPTDTHFHTPPNRPDALNAPTIAARLRLADLVHRANIDDDVKVLVIRGVGKNLGSGADLEEQDGMLNPQADTSLLHEFKIAEDGTVYTSTSNFPSWHVEDAQPTLIRVQRTAAP